MTVLEMKVEALLRCVDQDELKKAMTEVSGGVVPDCAEDTLHRGVGDYLVKFGTPAHIKGYRYLKYAVELVVKDEDLIDAITCELYPAVARRFNTTPSRVERAIRHAVEVTWDRGDWHLLQQYFGSTISKDKCKPTNSEFIARLANIIRDQVR